MPRPPGMMDKINYVVKYVENPCDAPWTIYFETLLPALGKAVIAVLSFGMGDLFRGYFRPKGLRAKPRRGKGKKGRFKTAMMPEVGNVIGKKLPGAEIAGRAVGGQDGAGKLVKAALAFQHGTKNLWIIDLGLQRLLWWWLIIDITVDFFYHWTSLINQSEFCSKQNATGIAVTGNGGAFLGLFGWAAILLPNILWQRGGVNWNVSTLSLPPGLFQLALGLTVKNVDPTPLQFQIGMFFATPFDNPIVLSEVETIQPGEQRDFVAAIEWHGGGQVVIQGRTFGGNATGIEGAFTAMQLNV